MGKNFKEEGTTRKDNSEQICLIKKTPKVKAKKDKTNRRIE